MNAAHSSANSALFGNEKDLSVSRALSELQARRPICVNAPGEVLFALPVEGLDNQRLHEFAVLCSPSAPKPDRHTAAGARDRHRGVSPYDVAAF